MKLYECDLCLNAVQQFSSLYLIQAHFLPDAFIKDFCGKCQTKANEYLSEIRGKASEKEISDMKTYFLDLRRKSKELRANFS